MKTKAKRFFDKVVSVVLSAAMFVGIAEVGIGTSVNAADELPEKSGSGVSTQNDISVNSTNSFGDLLSKEISNEDIEESESVGCKIFTAEVTDDRVSVEFQTLKPGTLVAAIYDEDGIKLISTGKTDVSPEDTSAEITLDTYSMPEYFYLRVFLVDTTTLRPMCKVYDCPNYTKEMQEFLAKTTDDFDSDSVLNLDNDKTNNFAVYSDKTNVIPESKTKNKVVSADDESGVYVFDNIDDNISSLKSGDIFAYDYGDDLIIAKVDDITIDGTKATVTSQDTSMEEVFDYVKIDEESDTSKATVDDSNLEEGILYEGKVENAESARSGDIMTCGYDLGGSVTVSDKFKIDKKFGSDDNNAKFTAALNIKLTASMKLYISLSYQYFEFNLGYSTDVSMSLTANSKLTKKLPLATFGFAICPGLYVELTPSLVLEASVSMELSGTLEGSVGFRVSNKNGFEDTGKSPSFKPEFKIEGTLFLGLSLEPKVKVISKYIAQVSVDATVGAEVKATYTKLTPKDKNVIHECKNCIDGDISFKMTIDIKIKLLNMKSLTFDFKVLNLKVHLFDFYWSLDFGEFGFKKCPHNKYRLEIKTVDQNRNPVEEATVEVDGETYTTDTDGTVIAEVPAKSLEINAYKDGIGSDTRRNFNVKYDKRITMVLALQNNFRFNKNLSYRNFGTNVCQYNGHTYQAFEEELSWSSAKKRCEELGGHLATITSEEEEYAIINLIQTGNRFFYWLGGTDEEEEGNWKWVTGEVWDYQDWLYGQPDNYSVFDDTTENYLSIKREERGWNDLQIKGDSYGTSSIENSGFICEWETPNSINSIFKLGADRSISETAEKFSKINTTAIATSANTKTKQFSSLIPNCTYNFYVVQTRNTKDILSDDNLLYISQSTADENGKLTVTYDTVKWYEREECFVIQAEQTDIANAEIKIDSITANGTEQSVEPIVTIDGETLMNGIDYDLAGDFKVKEVGKYTITVEGIGMYKGEKTVSFVVLSGANETGDTNNDGEVNIADALMISRYDAGLAELNEDQLAVSDINNDGEVNIADALMISRFDAGLISEL